MQAYKKYFLFGIYLMGALQYSKAQPSQMEILNWYDSLLFPTSELFLGETYQNPKTSYGNPFFRMKREAVKLIAYKGELRESDLMIDIYNFKVIVPVFNKSSFSYIILDSHNIDSICIDNQVFFYHESIDGKPRLAQKLFYGDVLALYKIHYKRPELSRVDTYQLTYQSDYILWYNEQYFKISSWRDYQRLFKDQKKSIKTLIDQNLLQISSNENQIFLLKHIEKTL